MYEVTALLACGHFPESLHRAVTMTAMEYAMDEISRGHTLYTDLPRYGLPILHNWVDNIHPLPPSFFRAFPSDNEYYQALADRVDRFILLACPRYQDQLRRVNQISFLCEISDLWLFVHLF